MLNRRSFLSNTAAIAAFSTLGKAGFAESCDPAPKLPASTLFDRDEDAYWAEIRKQFLIPEDEVYLNNGTVGSSPRPVLEAVFNGFRDTEKMGQADPEDYPIWGYGPFNEFRDPIAAFVGAQRDQIALVRNATEANSYIANGLELKSGDEVLITDQEHPGGEEPWNLRAKRYGVVVKKITLPKPAQNANEVLNLINDGITPRTRVIFLSHITTATGLVMPVKEICALARSKGIISAIDGAHATGMMRVNLNDLGCDLYTSSPHKWLQAPKGSGFLFIREEVLDRMWNTIVTAGWDEPKLKAERFQRIGSSNVPLLWGFRAAVEFANSIGMDRIERRHRKMADYLHAEMVKRGAVSWTSPDSNLRCGIATVTVAPVRMPELETWLWREHKIRIRGGAPNKIRLSTPYYLQKAEIDRFLDGFDRYKKNLKG